MIAPLKHESEPLSATDAMLFQKLCPKPKSKQGWEQPSETVWTSLYLEVAKAYRCVISSWYECGCQEK